MTAKLVKIAGFSPTPYLEPATEGPMQPPATGWDPYEVWRTRVLLPRLRDDGLEKDQTIVAESERFGPKKA